MLIEVAPGVDLEADVLKLLDWPVEVAGNVRTMDSAIFDERALGAGWRPGRTGQGTTS